MKPYFSIIIPALNEEKYLPKLLSDLTKQTFTEYEVILVDGRSEDQTVKKAQSFSKNLTDLSVITSNTRNVSYQRNLGASVAKGPYLVFMDADNRIPAYFLLGLKYRIETTNALTFSCWFSTEKIKDVDSLLPFVINYYVELQKNTPSPFAVESLMGFKKEVFRKLGGFDVNIPTHEGNAILEIAAKKGYRFHLFKDPSYLYSFRRIRKQGKLKSISTFVQLEASRLFGLKLNESYWRSIYPMLGGKYFDGEKARKQPPMGKLLLMVNRILNGEV